MKRETCISAVEQNDSKMSVPGKNRSATKTERDASAKRLNPQGPGGLNGRFLDRIHVAKSLQNTPNLGGPCVRKPGRSWCIPQVPL